MNKFRVLKKDKELLVYYEDGENPVKIYSGDTEKIWSHKMLVHTLKNNRRSKYILIKSDDNNIIDFYNKFKIKRTLILNKLDFDMYKYGSVPKSSVNYLFKLLTEQNIKADIITKEESVFIEGAMMGGLIFGYKYKGPSYKYDINSFYPSIYSSTNLLIPIKQGIIKTLTNTEFKKMDYFPIGIYRVKIKYNKTICEQRQNKLFRLNSEHYYTHIELNYAKQLKLNLELIEEDNNFLEYSRDKCLNGSQMFKKYVDTFYSMKIQSNNKELNNVSKEFLNTLWGALCRKIEKDIHTNNLSQNILENKYDNITILLNSEGSPYFSVSSNDKLYKYNYARLKPFLTAKGRITLANTIYDNIDNIHRCHTDGIISDKQLNLKISNKLGEWKYEGYCENTIIKNSIKIDGTYVI